MTVRSDPPSGPDPEAGPESLLGPAGPSAPADAGQAGAPTGGQVGPPITVHAGELTADRAGERATAQAAGESAEARILRAALTLFARQGFSATGVRALGREAGVSPGLVLHYFGSKEGLRAAVERLVTSRVAETFRPVEDLAQWREAFESLLEDQPEAVAYLRRALVEPEAAGAQLFDELLEVAGSVVTALQAGGIVRASDDPPAQLMVLLCLSLGPIVLGDHVQRHLGAPDPHRAGRRYSGAATDLMAHGFYSSRPAPGPTSE